MPGRQGLHIRAGVLRRGARNTSTNSYSGTLYYGTLYNGDPASDLTNGSTSVTSLAGYIEFASTITENTPLTQRVSQLPVEAVVTTTGNQRISQLVVEAIKSNLPATMRVSQLVIEVVSPSIPVTTAVETSYTWIGTDGAIWID